MTTIETYITNPDDGEQYDVTASGTVFGEPGAPDFRRHQVRDHVLHCPGIPGLRIEMLDDADWQRIDELIIRAWSFHL